ncbi:MAG: hypothetical protein IJO14_03410 [Clostridia bacterium]|jgi:predicted  nucleic acid-binding Zn-ribbon protein|nr:hypothetical protein [Clostridia bacterium]
MAKRKDILAKKQEELAGVVAMFETAVSVVSGVVKNLSDLNTQIDTEIQEIDEYQRELSSTRDSLASARSKNERIMQNFSSLLSVE